MRYTYPKRQLVPPPERETYGQAVITWLEKALPLYSHPNVSGEGRQWTAANNASPVFAYSHGDYSVRISPSRPTELLYQHGSVAKARVVLFQIAAELVREADPASERALRTIKTRLLEEAVA